MARGQITRVHLPIPGGFTIYNALAALACGLCLDIPLDKAAAPLRAVRGVKGRVEVVPVPTAYTVIIDYAHTPDALENILTTARDFTAGRLICVFGCGGDRDRGKRPLMGAVAASVMALALDFLLGRVEKAVTSEGLLPPDQIKNLSRTVRRRRRNVAWGLCVALIGVSVLSYAALI